MSCNHFRRRSTQQSGLSDTASASLAMSSDHGFWACPDRELILLVPFRTRVAFALPVIRHRTRSIETGSVTAATLKFGTPSRALKSERTMALFADGSGYADPIEHGRLGQDVELVLHALAGMVEQIQCSEDEDQPRRTRDVASFVLDRHFFLVHRRREVGRLFTAVEEEFKKAESVILGLNSLARSWWNREEVNAFPGVDKGWVKLLPRTPHTECTSSMMLLAKSIRHHFPGNTGERWREMARIASQRTSAQRCVAG